MRMKYPWDGTGAGDVCYRYFLVFSMDIIPWDSMPSMRVRLPMRYPWNAHELAMCYPRGPPVGLHWASRGQPMGRN